jgi:thioester reductase-like protein
MAYFVTGATGFIGRRLVKKLLQREGEIYFLILEREMPKLEELRVFWGGNEQRIIPVVGDLTQPKLGVAEADLAKLKGQVKHLFHLAAIYDLKASGLTHKF